jgi:hypothetical protein
MLLKRLWKKHNCIAVLKNLLEDRAKACITEPPGGFDLGLQMSVEGR